MEISWDMLSFLLIEYGKFYFMTDTLQATVAIKL